MSPITTTDHDVIVIGAGQAGLAIGYHLARQGRDFVILDGAARIGDTWRSRWDSLRLFTPAQYDGLPGMPFPADADTYPGKDQVAAYLETYATTFGLPVRLDTRVTRLSRDGDRFVVDTASGSLSASQVVVATGPFQTPAIPRMAADLDAQVTQLHSGAYRNPDQVPDGTVVVVGGNSGCQIAQELAATHPVHLALGQRLPVLPQRLAGRDLFWWLTTTRLMRITADSRPGRRLRQRDAVIGTGPRQLRRHGARVRPRVTAAAGRTIDFADGSQLDDVAAVIWATGYRLDHSWVDVPEGIDDAGVIIQRRGVTPTPGLYTIGQAWQHTRGSGLLGFVADDAAELAERIAGFAPPRDAACTAPTASTEPAMATTATEPAMATTATAGRRSRSRRLAALSSRTAARSSWPGRSTAPPRQRSSATTQVTAPTSARSPARTSMSWTVSETPMARYGRP